MIISIDQRLVTAAALVKETFTDKDAQDHYWDITLSGTARITEAVIAVATVIHFLISLRTWMQRLDHEHIEQYQTALPAAPTAKLLCASAQPDLDTTDPWDGQIEVEQGAAVLIDGAREISSSPQLLLAPDKQTSAPGRKTKRTQSGTKPKSRTKTKTKAKTAIA